MKEVNWSKVCRIACKVCRIGLEILIIGVAIMIVMRFLEVAILYKLGIAI